MPIQQYRKDGRVVRGLQKGSSSFGTSTAMAAVELTNRLVQTIQVRPLGVMSCCYLCLHFLISGMYGRGEDV